MTVDAMAPEPDPTAFDPFAVVADPYPVFARLRAATCIEQQELPTTFGSCAIREYQPSTD